LFIPGDVYRLAIMTNDTMKACWPIVYYGHHQIAKGHPMKYPHEFTYEEMCTELDKLTDRELAAYRNILIMSRQCVQSEQTRALNATHFEIVTNIATQRNLI